MMNEQSKKWSLRDVLIGENVSAVQFVMDYLQLHFNSKGFTFYIWPIVEINNETYRFGDIEYRNKLCELIDKKTVDVNITENDSLIVNFEKSDSIKLNINPDNPEIFSEIAIFWDADGSWAVFE